MYYQVPPDGYMLAMSSDPERVAAHRVLRRIVNRIARLILFMQGPRDPGDMWRAGGDCVCRDCGDTYWRHVVDPYDPFLHVLCTGERVKL